jgi:hypothetical protein
MAIQSQNDGQLKDTSDQIRASLDLGTFPRSSLQIPVNTPIERDNFGLSQDSILNSVPRFPRRQETEAGLHRAATFHRLKVSCYPHPVVEGSLEVVLTFMSGTIGARSLDTIHFSAWASRYHISLIGGSRIQ